LHGLRKDKYRALESQDVESSDWQKLAPAAPYFYLYLKMKICCLSIKKDGKFLP